MTGLQQICLFLQPPKQSQVINIELKGLHFLSMPIRLYVTKESLNGMARFLILQREANWIAFVYQSYKTYVIKTACLSVLVTELLTSLLTRNPCQAKLKYDVTPRNFLCGWKAHPNSSNDKKHNGPWKHQRLTTFRMLLTMTVSYFEVWKLSTKETTCFHFWQGNVILINFTPCRLSLSRTWLSRLQFLESILFIMSVCFEQLAYIHASTVLLGSYNIWQPLHWLLSTGS